MKARIIELEAKIRDVRTRMPAHSVKPEMVLMLEELEDELEILKAGETDVRPVNDERGKEK
ncbi:MAG: hypothetical protein VR69_13390 [Peptococcaceae bacterium BRH_c4b]|nr:MAG: hypothetical protein VR69_13390 [Peptococcaceae bacterium BRH_c4b]